MQTPSNSSNSSEEYDAQEDMRTKDARFASSFSVKRFVYPSTTMLRGLPETQLCTSLLKRGIELYGSCIVVAGFELGLPPHLRIQMETFLADGLGDLISLSKLLSSYATNEHLFSLTYIEDFIDPNDFVDRHFGSYPFASSVPLKVRKSRAKLFTVIVSSEEFIRSEQTLEVRAISQEEAKDICEKDRDYWRNGDSSDLVKIVKDEAPVDSDLSCISYAIVPKV